MPCRAGKDIASEHGEISTCCQAGEIVEEICAGLASAVCQN
jgi:hypothetical protein